MVYDDCLVLLRDIGLRLSVLADLLRQRDITDSFSRSHAYIEPSVRSDVVSDIVADDLYALRERIVEALGESGDYGDCF